FERLVNRIVTAGLFNVEDIDQKLQQSEEIVQNWVNSFQGSYNTYQIKEACRCFSGVVLLRARVTVAHDSYERLIEVTCSSEGQYTSRKEVLDPIGKYLQDPNLLGLPIENLLSKAMEDEGIVEFQRFYQERLRDEIKAAGEDIRKQKKQE